MRPRFGRRTSTLKTYPWCVISPSQPKLPNSEKSSRCFSPASSPHEREKLLPETLAAIRAAATASLAPAGIDWELIVCDNNSPGCTAAAAAGATVVFEPVNQIGRARNTGATAAHGEWILFVDADSTPSASLFADLADALHDPKILGGGGLLHMPLEQRGARNALAIWHWISTRCRYAAGSFLLVRTASFREAGGFDTAFFAGGEIFLSKKLKKLAKRDRQEFVILTKYPMPTSPGKLPMHHPWHHLAWLLRTIANYRVI